MQRYLRAVLRDGQPIVTGARLQQSGRFNLAADGDRWVPFTARQWVATRRPGFVWDARVALAPGLTVHVHDAYVAGEGLLQPAVAGLVGLAGQRGGGDIAVGVALATACAWVIEAAALGLFLSFLMWLVGTLLALALSQYLVHPAVQLVLSDRKLDGAVDALSVFAEAAQDAGAQVGGRLMRFTRQSWQTMAGRVRPT